MIGITQLSALRSRLELMLSIPPGSPYVNSAPELQDINEGYQQTAYAYDWPSLLTRVGIPKVANLDRYSLPSNFRKLDTVKLDNVTMRETDLNFIKKTRSSYVIDQTQDDIIINPIPRIASVAFTLSNAETAGNAVTIELDTVSGLSQFDEIWIDSASGTDEFTLVSSVDSSATTITARLDADKSASDIIYRQKDILDIQYYRRVTLLSGASDTTLLPPALDLILLFKSISLAYARLEQFDESRRNHELWLEQMREVFLAFDKSSVGYSNQYTL